MLKFEQPKSLDFEMFEKLVEFIEAFLHGSHEDMTVSDVIRQITACDPKKSAVWFIYEDDILKGYLFAEVTSNYEGIFTAIHQLYMNGVKDRKVYNEILNLLIEFGRPLGSNELIFSTDHNPEAFIRLMRLGFKVESHILSLTY